MKIKFISVVVIVAIIMGIVLVNIGLFNDRYANLIITIIGSCVGFGLALLGSRAVEAFSDDKRIMIAKINIEDELRFICGNLFYPYGSDEITDLELYYDTPIWTSVVSTGDILRIRKHEQFFRAALASYRQLELLRMEEAKIFDWENLDPAERQRVISNRRYVRRLVEGNLEDISESIKNVTKLRKSKEHEAINNKDKERFGELIDQFKESAGRKGFPKDFTTIFDGRDIKEKGLFFYTDSLDKVFAGNARYGIGFGEYDCEIYLRIVIKNEEDGLSNLEEFLNILDNFDSVKSGDILKTQYEFKNKTSYNYSRIILASKCNKYTCDRNSIVDVTIRNMIKELVEFEKRWLMLPGIEGAQK